MRFGVVSLVKAVIQRRTASLAARFLAILAVVLQVSLPGTLALAEANGLDVSRFICGSSGQVSAEAQAAIEQLAQLLDDEAPDHQPFDGHCPYCTLVQLLPVPEPVPTAEAADFTASTAYVRYESAAFLRDVRGAPCGSRGPPSYL